MLITLRVLLGLLGVAAVAICISIFFTGAQATACLMKEGRCYAN